MLFDTITIVSCILIVLLALLSIIANPFVRRVDRNGDNESKDVADENLPKVTVLVLANNKAQALDAHLPLILTQDYPAGYEVVVVGEQGDTPTEAVLKQFSQNSRLYTTSVPARSLFMSKTKLAVALGVKAAHNEWILLINSDCRPQSDTWLKSMARKMHDDANLVIGYSNYGSDTKAFYRFDRLRNSCYTLRKAARSTAYRACGTNVAFRRSEFIEEDGYRGNLQFVNGEYDFIVNKFARPGSARIAIDHESFVLEDTPSRKAWLDQELYYAHIRRYMQRSFGQRSVFNIDMAIMHIAYILLIAYAIVAALAAKWIVLCAALLSLVSIIVARSFAARKVYRKFDEPMSVWKTVFFELFTIWHRLATKIRYAKSDKSDFTTHKL